VTGAGERRSRLAFALLLLLGAAFIAGFVALGVWQLQRRAWKLDLIERVEARVDAPPVPAPGPAAWPRISAANAEYLRVRARGRFLDGQVLVQAVTELGPGYWVLAPLETDRGFVLLVNRGFVPRDWRPAAPTGSGSSVPVVITGLLRLSEPGGAFLRKNDPERGRWFSRDVAVIAKALRLGTTAPYFVDASAAPVEGAGPWPRGGLTQIRFRNSHLSYALTWFGLAILVSVGLVLLVRYERRRVGWIQD
jgi:surfeit locus 1 family protein